MAMVTRKFMQSDLKGNVLVLAIHYDSDTPKDEARVSADITLVLRNEKRTRTVGKFDYSNSTLYVKRNSSKHLHLKTKSYGFNWTVINESAMFQVEKIYLVEDEGAANFLFPVSILKEFGTFLMFQQQGFELQKFLPVSLIEPFKITRNEPTV
jgi:hypothetical protein